MMWLVIALLVVIAFGVPTLVAVAIPLGVVAGGIGIVYLFWGVMADEWRKGQHERQMRRKGQHEPPITQAGIPVLQQVTVYLVVFAFVLFVATFGVPALVGVMVVYLLGWALVQKWRKGQHERQMRRDYPNLQRRQR